MLKYSGIEEALEVNSEVLKLTKREREVLRFWMNDYDYRQIGTALNISPNTVKAHISRINTKLQVNSKASLILKVMGL